MDRSQEEYDVGLALVQLSSSGRRWLAPPQQNDAQGHVLKICFPPDIFTRLPLELSQRIAQYLPLIDATRARRVSKNWQYVLTSHQTSQLLLRPWHRIGASTLRIPDGLSLDAISSLKAEHVWAYQTGTPVDQLTMQWPISPSGPLSTNVAYSNGRVAWIDETRAMVHLLCLEDDGGHTRFVTDPEWLSNLALSKSMLAVTTLGGQCRAIDLAAQHQIQFRFSPANVIKVVIDEDTLAILHGPAASNPMQFYVTTWTLRDHNRLVFTANLHRSPKQALGLCDLKIMLDISRRSVVIFERVAEASVVYFTRFSLEGRVQTEGALKLPSIEGFARFSEKSTPTNDNEWATVWSYSTIKRTSGKYLLSPVLRVQYKSGHDILRLKQDSLKLWQGDDVTRSEFFFWHDTAYCHERYYDFANLKVADFSKSNFEYAIMGRFMDMIDTLGLPHYLSHFRNAIRPEHFQEGIDDVSNTMLASVFLGDERFLVNACQYGLVIWAFDKNHGMTVTDAGFKERREDARKNKQNPWLRWSLSRS